MFPTEFSNLNVMVILYQQMQVPEDLAVEMFPHYMERDRSFTSKSILGLIYDEVGRWQHEDLSGKG